MSLSKFCARLGAVLLGFMVLVGDSASAQMPFFPGAEGFGGSYTGSAPSGGWFANADVYHVTNLNNSGPGSFRNAFSFGETNRIVVFDVGGTIQLTSPIEIRDIKNYYVAGQTAPSPVTIYGASVNISHNSSGKNENVILRYMGFRKGTGPGEDAITFPGGSGPDGLATNMILDHVTASWAEDENLSVTNWNTNVTVQHSIISDALDGGGNHAYGSLLRAETDSQVTFHHNLYANNLSRQPRLGNYNDSVLTGDMRNNIVYNFGGRAAYAGGSGGSVPEGVDVNFVGNYTIAGPDTTAGDPTDTFVIDRNARVEAFQAGNFVDADGVRGREGEPNGTDLGWSQFQLLSGRNNSLTQRATPFDMPPVTTQNAPDAYNYVVEHVGNWWWNREAIDARVIGNVVNNTGPVDGLSPNEPNATELAGLLSTPMGTHAAGYDADGDGMEGSWELMHGLDPNNPNDWNGDFDADGYIDLVEFINDKGAFPAPAPIVSQGPGRYADFNNWRTDDSAATGGTGGTAWQPSRFDNVVIGAGLVTVDAPGQHAGELTVSDSSLLISDGWLAVEEELVLSGDSFVFLQGGELLAPSVRNLGANSPAIFLSGGVLRAGTVEGTLQNDGATIAPGLDLLGDIGSTHIDGALLLGTGGALQIEVADVSTTDTVTVDGAVTLGGVLDVLFLDLYDPASGSWDILTATGGFTGAFDTLPEGFTTGISGDTLTLYYNLSPVLPGDFNGDGMVDILDLDILSGNFGTTGGATLAQGDANGDGNVDILDLDILSGNFGASGPSTAVPEPGLLLTMLIVSVAGIAFRR